MRIKEGEAVADGVVAGLLSCSSGEEDDEMDFLLEEVAEGVQEDGVEDGDVRVTAKGLCCRS